MTAVSRPGQRAADALRPVRITRGYTMHAEGSVLIEFGHTRVLCTASVEEKVPPHKRGSGEGWVTAEYGMLPRATHTRSDREAAKGKQSGRTQEIQRLIGRSLRSVFDLSKLGERTISLDCDVLQADGGTRTASITGAFVAAQDAVNKLIAEGKLAASPIKDHVAAISVGILDGQALLDLVPPHHRLKMHREIAAQLADMDAVPANVARHWLEGGRPSDAMPWLLAAARDAAHIDGGHARLARLDGHARQEFREILEIGDIQLVELARAQRLDADRHILQIFFALLRGDENRLDGSHLGRLRRLLRISRRARQRQVLRRTWRRHGRALLPHADRNAGQSMHFERALDPLRIVRADASRGHGVDVR